MAGFLVSPAAVLCTLPYRQRPILPLIYFSLNLKEDQHEYEFECRGRTLTGACDRDINFAGTEVFKLFRGCVFDRRGYLGANAP